MRHLYIRQEHMATYSLVPRQIFHTKQKSVWGIMGTMEGTKHNFILYREQSTASTLLWLVYLLCVVYINCAICTIFNLLERHFTMLYCTWYITDLLRKVISAQALIFGFMFRLQKRIDLGNDRNVTNRQFKKHCLAYEQNAWRPSEL